MAIFRRSGEEGVSPPSVRPAAVPGSSSGPGSASGSTWIGKDTVLEGKITTRDDTCIQGRLHGAVESSASVTIPEGGEVEADIVARSVAIEGRVSGNIEARETAELKPSGVVVGEILASRVVVRAGATFEGSVRRQGAAGLPEVRGIRAISRGPEIRSGPGLGIRNFRVCGARMNAGLRAPREGDRPRRLGPR